MNVHSSIPSRLALAAGLLFLIAAVGHAQPAGQCGTWNPVPSPSPGDEANGLLGVTALSPAEAWAVGSQDDSAALSAPLVVRFDGAAWHEVPLHDSLSTTALAGVGSTPGGHVWAVGSRYVWSMLTEPRILHWEDGALVGAYTPVLRKQTVYPYYDRSGYPEDVDGTGPDDVWVVGDAAGFGDANATMAPMALHWDGTAWTEVDVPLVANRVHYLNGVAALAPDDVWAVGYYRDVANLYRAVTYHWDGADWSRVPNPAESIAGETFLYDVTAVAPDDVWAVGQRPGGALFMHWDGAAWTIAQSPVSRTTWIDEVAAIASDDVWAVGALDTSSFFHWDGTSWTEIPVAGPMTASSFSRAGGLAAVGPCDVWSVGAYNDGASGFTFVERLQPGSTPPSLDVEVTVTSGSPVPPSGGAVRYSVAVTNTTTASISTQYWVEVTQPNGRLLKQGPFSATVAAGATFTASRSLRLTSRNPAGTYTLTAKVGTYLSPVVDSDVATFTKNATAPTAEATRADGVPTEYALEGPAPNPFRGQARLTLAVVEAQHVTAAVYDGLGRRVALLHDGALEAGVHGLTFEGDGLPAGVYVVRVTGETFALTRRATMLR